MAVEADLFPLYKNTFLFALLLIAAVRQIASGGGLNIMVIAVED